MRTKLKVYIKMNKNSKQIFNLIVAVNSILFLSSETFHLSACKLQ